MFALTCLALHPEIPALAVGNVISLSRTRGGGLTLHLPLTPGVTGALVAALRDGALAPPVGDDPFWHEIEREIMATRDELLARADQLLSQNSAAHLRAS